MLPFLALDTEATGLNYRKGAFPYAVCTADVRGKTWFTQWPVDPFSRKVAPKASDVRHLKKQIVKSRMVFHNAKFDIRMLSCLKIGINAIWRAYEDTSLIAHVSDASDVPHRLKELAIKYLEVLDDDEKALRDRVKSIRINEARHYGWAIGEDIEMDYWMPMELYRRGEGEPGDDTLLEEYNARDTADRTMGLWNMYRLILEDHPEFLKPYNREKILQRTVYRMETRGVTLIPRKLEAELRRYTGTATKHENVCKQIAIDKLNWTNEFNIGSGQQLQRILFTEPTQRRRNHESDQTYGFGLQPTKITSQKEGKTNYSVDKHELPKLLVEVKELKLADATTFLENVLHYRKNETAVRYLSGYKEKAIVTRRVHGNKSDMRLHPNLKQTGTQTTRFSHSNPNTANVSKGDKLDPKDEDSLDFTLREVFGPSWGRIWYALDYNQLQLRIFAKCAGEEAFMKALREGYDAHTWVATQIFDCDVSEVDKLRRRIAKNVNFGFIFGAGEKKIDLTSGIRGLSKKIAKLFPAAHDFMQHTISHVKRHGWVETLGGYRLPVPSAFAYAGVCYIVQGTEGDIVKNAMIDCDSFLQKETNDEAFISLQVHDELVFDFPRTGSNHEGKIQGYIPKAHKLALAEIARLMIKAGADLGVETPVACEKIVVDWANGVTQPIGEIYVRRYRRTGKHKGDYYATGGGREYPGRTKERRAHKLVHKV